MELLDEDYSENKYLILSSLEGIGSVFDLQVSSSFLSTLWSQLTVVRSHRPLETTSAGCSCAKAYWIPFRARCYRS